MNFFKKHKSIKKLAIMIGIIFIIIVIGSTKQTKAVSLMGSLLAEIIKLIVSLADGAMAVLQKIVFNADTYLIVLEDNWIKSLLLSVIALGVIASVFVGITNVLILTTIVVITTSGSSSIMRRGRRY